MELLMEWQKHILLIEDFFQKLHMKMERKMENIKDTIQMEM